MFKKVFSLLLAFSFLFALTACGNNEKTPEKVTNDLESSDTSALSDDVSKNDNITETPTDEKSPTSDKNNITTTSPVAEKVKVTVPEGYTLARIGMLLEQKGLCTDKEFIEAAQTYKSWLDTSKYPFLKDMQNAKNVCFYLEGYLFPATYEFTKGMSAQDIVKTMLDGTSTYFNNAFLSKISQSGYNLHEILTIASIIEKEVKTAEQRPMVSSVIHNRIKANMKLECDPTTYYCEYVIKPYLPNKFDYYVNYYSSKRVKGLISGPICNAGMASINAAISPAATDYLFFIIEKDPPYTAHYSNTYEEHSSKWENIKNS